MFHCGLYFEDFSKRHPLIKISQDALDQYEVMDKIESFYVHQARAE